MQKKVNIIGGGVSGLSAGCYLQMNGFETEIFEKHSIPGGLCTSWTKGEFTINGCAHFILGSDEGSSFYKLWSELLDMKKIPFFHHDERITVEVKNNVNKYGKKDFHLLTNINKLQAYLLDLAPEDSKEINKLIKSIRVMQKFDLPPVNDKLPFFQSMIRGIKMMRYIEFLILILRLKNQTNFTFAEKLKNPFLKESFQLLFDGDEDLLLILTLPIAALDKNSAGYPIGASLNFSKRLEEQYLKLGGKMHYNTPVKKIIVENGIAKGLLVRNNKTHYSDITLSAADWNYTIFDALDGKFTDKKINELKELKVNQLFFSAMQFSFGIANEFKDFPHYSRFPIDTEIVSPDGTVYNRLEVHIYNYDPTLAPAGKTVVTVSFFTKNRNYWIDLRKNDRKRYREEKKLFLEQVIPLLDKRLNGIKDKIEMIDVATPASFYRYTNNWEGSTQGWLHTKNIMAFTPVGYKLPGLKNFYLASHWNQPGGGLPIAIKSGREVTQLICKENKVEFKGKTA